MSQRTYLRQVLEAVNCMDLDQIAKIQEAKVKIMEVVEQHGEDGLRALAIAGLEGKSFYGEESGGQHGVDQIAKIQEAKVKIMEVVEQHGEDGLRALAIAGLGAQVVLRGGIWWKSEMKILKDACRLPGKGWAQ